ncbi:PEP-CTERM sorting domain-containing protein [Planctomycetota bacterium]|nr:PEP-CTERM sorting domain-containing protein [Planctomycetota bacterium]
MGKTQHKSQAYTTKALAAAILTASAGFMNVSVNAEVANRDQMTFYIETGAATGTKTSGTVNPIGGYTYDAANDTWWTIGYGTSAQIRKLISDGEGGYVPAPLTYTDDFEGGYVYPTDWMGFISTTDQQNADTNYDWKSTTPIAGNILLNPTEITVQGKTYAPNSVAILTQSGGALNKDTANTADTKLVYLYDLREIGATQEVNGRDLNSNGIIDWEDVFVPIANKPAMNLAAGYDADYKESASMTYSPSWSGDGQSIYFVEQNRYGGVFQTNIATGEVKRIFTADSNTKIKSSVHQIQSSVKNLTGSLYEGDQLLVAGSSASDNVGGLDVLIDDGVTADEWSSYSLISADQLNDFLELGVNDEGEKIYSSIKAVTTDTEGNVYFRDGKRYGIFKLDTEGRLSKVASEREIESFQNENGASSSNANTFDFMTRKTSHDFENGVEDVTELLYSDPALKSVIGVKIFETGDFNRDNIVDSADIALFKDALQLRGVRGTDETEKFDLNGNASGNRLYNYKDSTHVFGIVDYKDVKLLQQFYAFNDGDANMDQNVDINDAIMLVENYGGTENTWITADFTGDDTVDITDAITLVNNYGTEATLAAPTITFDSASDTNSLLADSFELGPSALSLIVDLSSGEMKIVGDALLTVFSIKSDSGSLIADADGFQTPFMYLSNTVSEVAAMSFSGFDLSDALLLDAMFKPSGIQDLVFEYGLKGFSESFTGIVNIVPEPTSLALMFLAVPVLTLRSRSKQA